MSVREDVATHPEIAKILPTVFRSLERKDKVGFSRSFAKGFRRLALRTRGGLYLGTHPAYDVNMERVDRVVARIAKGLFCHELGHRLPSDYEVFAACINMIDDLDEDSKNTLRALTQRPIRVVGEQVFYYAWSSAVDDENTTAWLLGFYRRVWFFSLTLPRSRNHPGLLPS
jgi:hypothetical protein